LWHKENCVQFQRRLFKVLHAAVWLALVQFVDQHFAKADVQHADWPARLPETELSELEPAWPAAEACGFTPRCAPVFLPGTGDFNHCWHSDHGLIHWQVLGRGFYDYDHRIEFTGQESTFGVEGHLRGAYTRYWDEIEYSIVSELFLNQPFDRNMLADTPERRSYLANFEIEPLEIMQLQLTARYHDCFVALGKLPTPFGRYYFPLVTNDFHDAPFIRTESIQWRETGALVQYDPSFLVLTAALTNGNPDRDANSSKAAIARVGIDGGDFACGVSAKLQDGIGSEQQKTFNNHVGVDALVRRGNWVLSGECIYDEYGLRRPFDPNDITWERSIYYRDLNVAEKEPICGVGYYVDLTYCGENWTWMFDYGEFYPDQIGVPQHDVTTRRGIVKGIYRFHEHAAFYGMFLRENNVPNAQDGRDRRAWDVLCGVEITL
jgi:hypothetical protein